MPKWTEYVDLFVSDKQSKYGAAPQSTVSSVGEALTDGKSNSFFDWLTRGAEVVSAVNSSLKAPNTPASTTPGTSTTAAPATVANASWLPWALGGGVVLLLVWLVAKR